MKILGLIVEYNPFHQGHLYHLRAAKDIVKPDLTVAIMSGNFVQRGEPAIISKFDRANIAVKHGCDLVVELPLVYSVQAANQFAHGAIKLLNELRVTDIVFGSESGDIDFFKEIALKLQDSTKYHELVRELLKTGISYSDACNQALLKLDMPSVASPNNLLGLAYTKEVINNYPHIKLHCIKRSNSYHEKSIQTIPSATSLRLGLYEKRNLENILIGPEHFCLDLFYLEHLFPMLKYNLITRSPADLEAIHLVDEGIENLMLKNIMSCHNMHDFVNSLTSRRYSRSRIQRTIIHILLNNSAREINVAQDLDYLRVLKSNGAGFGYLRILKELTDFKLITNFSSHSHPALSIELKGAALLSLISSTNDVHIREIANKPKTTSSFMINLDAPEKFPSPPVSFYGVCLFESKILMVKGGNGAFYLPGGVSEHNDYHDFLKSQIENQTGVQVSQMLEFLGVIQIEAPSLTSRSFYYHCMVKIKNMAMKPSCEFITVAQAIATNKSLLGVDETLQKEIAVLEQIHLTKN